MEIPQLTVIEWEDLIMVSFICSLHLKYLRRIVLTQFPQFPQSHRILNPSGSASGAQMAEKYEKLH
jgi:hypothetical protein